MNSAEKTDKLLELKAAAYDALVQVSSWQKKVQEIEQQIKTVQDIPADA